MAISEYELKHKRLRISGSLPRKIPDCNDENIAEIQRLVERKIPNVKKVDYSGCVICYSKNHRHRYCPCHVKIPSSIKEIGPQYDRICFGCGKIGLECCSAGSYAIRRWCAFCHKFGHWFWEERCPDKYPLMLSKYWLWQCFKDGKPIQERPLQVPEYTGEGEAPLDSDFEDVLRLMKRTTCAPPVTEGCCGLCYAKGHSYYHCEYVKSIPDGVVIGPDFDQVCAGCGKIGKRCCGVGAYPIDKWCEICLSHGHWYWDDKHDYSCSPNPERSCELAEEFKIRMLQKTLKREICPEMMKLTT